MSAAEVSKCVMCGHEIDDCAFCEEPDCKAPVCTECLAVTLKARMPQPHAHGG